MFNWLSTTQHKINAAIGLAAFIALVFGALLFWRSHQREKADKAVAAASVRAVKATAIDSVKQVLLQARIDTLSKEIKASQSFQQQQQMKNLLFSKRNENLNKQIDSLNGILGVRPKF